MLEENIVPLGVTICCNLQRNAIFTPGDVDWFLYLISHRCFSRISCRESGRRGCLIPEEKWFVNLPHVGNIASASAFAMIEELLYLAIAWRRDRRFL